MQFLKALPCLILTACSSFADADLPQKEDPAPVTASSVPDLRKAAEQENLVPPLEVAGPIAANPIEPGPWLICLRSRSPTNAGRPAYAVFFTDGKFNSVRAAAVIDNCESQVFSPIELDIPKSAAASASPPSPPPPSKKRHHDRGDS
ncbi:hypothetical protein SAMN05444158_0771 [Bradyrhizobium canariense]|uniref:Uncharacterized protein n=1 Tax=Bradyrhizobium canariense TaxID=255045 RepID=A0A1H1NV88_9BRAD|nr:hypothetical protein SAMN05444158_0771 [Bradyrhizobium canariense]